MLTLPHDPFADGLLAMLGIVLAVAYALRRAPGRGLDPRVVYGAFAAGIMGGLVGGHALFVASHGGGWLRFWEDQSVFGVLIGGGLVAGAYLRARRRPLLPYADLAAPAVALGYALARVGCFLRGDDFGTVTTGWGVRYAPGTPVWDAHAARGWIPADAAASLPVVPVQLGLSAVALAIFLVLVWTRRPPGGALAVAALGYGAGRFLLEPLRDDFQPIVAGLSLPQLLALGLAAAGAALLLRPLLQRRGPGWRRAPEGGRA